MNVVRSSCPLSLPISVQSPISYRYRKRYGLYRLTSDFHSPRPSVKALQWNISGIAPLVRLVQALVKTVGGLQDVPDSARGRHTAMSVFPSPSKSPGTGMSVGFAPLVRLVLGSGHTRRRTAGCTRHRPRDATPRCPSSRPRRSPRERGYRSGPPTCTPCTWLRSYPSEDCRMYQTPVEGRHTAMSVFPSPS